jgi:hypothetical protein
MTMVSSLLFLVGVSATQMRISLQNSIRSALVIQIWTGLHHFACKEGELLTFGKLFDASFKCSEEIGDLVDDPTAHVSIIYFFKTLL